MYYLEQVHPFQSNFVFQCKKLLIIRRVIELSSFFADYSKGFGGKYGVENDRVDKSAVGWAHKEKLEQHESQRGERFLIVVKD